MYNYSILAKLYHNIYGGLNFMQNLFGNEASSQVFSQVMLLVIMMVGLYFVMLRPNQKRRKKEEDMRKSLDIGHEITTIGGIVGKIISMKEDSDTVVIETASDKIRIKKWAIASCENMKSESK